MLIYVMSINIAILFGNGAEKKKEMQKMLTLIEHSTLKKTFGNCFCIHVFFIVACQLTIFRLLILIHSEYSLRILFFFYFSPLSSAEDLFCTLFIDFHVKPEIEIATAIAATKLAIRKLLAQEKRDMDLFIEK